MTKWSCHWTTQNWHKNSLFVEAKSNWDDLSFYSCLSLINNHCFSYGVSGTPEKYEISQTNKTAKNWNQQYSECFGWLILIWVIFPEVLFLQFAVDITLELYSWISLGCDLPNPACPQLLLLLCQHLGDKFWQHSLHAQILC